MPWPRQTTLCRFSCRQIIQVVRQFQFVRQFHIELRNFRFGSIQFRLKLIHAPRGTRGVSFTRGPDHRNCLRDELAQRLRQLGELIIGDDEHRKLGEVGNPFG